PMPGLWRVLARALTCEELSADRMGYTIGLLSGLADEVGVPASAVLEVAGVSREVADAIRYGTGPLGPVLRAVLAYERNDAAGVARTGVAAVDVYDAYLRGATEAMATAQALGSR
ncbi:MAG TPA: diguanylate phosphodiesterase, partial [Actinotalea sp.]|nr:diguanylate phosphodiesterase [Actinotalea sp.]